MNLTPARQIAIARGISEFGNTLRYLVISVAIVRINQHPQWIALNETLEQVGYLLSLFVLQIFIDRTNYSKSLYRSDAACFLLSAAFAWFISQGNLQGIIAASFLFFYIGSIHSTALEALTAELNIKEERSMIQGFTYLQLSLYLAGLVASLAGAALIKVVSLQALIFLDAASFLVSSIWVKRLHTRVSHLKAERNLEAAAPYKEFLDGWKYVWRTQGILPHIFSQTLFGFALAMVSATCIGHLMSVASQTPDAAVSYIFLAIKVGAVVGALIRIRLKLPIRASVLVGGFGMILSMFSLAASTTYLAVMVALILKDLSLGIEVVANRAIVQSRAVSVFRGRVAAIRSLAITIGMVGGGALATTVLRAHTTKISLVISAFVAAAALLPLLWERTWSERSV